MDRKRDKSKINKNKIFWLGSNFYGRVVGEDIARETETFETAAIFHGNEASMVLPACPQAPPFVRNWAAQ